MGDRSRWMPGLELPTVAREWRRRVKQASKHGVRRREQSATLERGRVDVSGWRRDGARAAHSSCARLAATSGDGDGGASACACSRAGGSGARSRLVSVRNVVPTLTSDKRQGLSLNGRC
jgi:hypothetical protein